MHAGYFPSSVVPICEDLTPSAVRFPGQWWAGMAVGLDRLVEIAVQSSVGHARIIEHLAKTLYWNQYDRRLFTHA